MEKSLEEEKLHKKKEHIKFFYQWDESKTILFRDATHTHRVTLDDHYEVVDITSSRESQDVTHHGGEREDLNTSLTLAWDGSESEKCHYSSCQLKLGQYVPTLFMYGICRDNYADLRWLCQKIFRSYKAKVIRVTVNPVTFLMMHENEEKFEAMQHDKLKLLEIFSNLFSLNESRNLNLSWSRNGSDTLRPQRQIGTDVQVLTDKDDKSRFEMIERELQSNEGVLKANFQEQRVLNENFIKAMERVSKEITEMKKVISELKLSREVESQSHEATDITSGSLSSSPLHSCQTQALGYDPRVTTSLISESQSAKPQLSPPGNFFCVQRDKTVENRTVTSSASQLPASPAQTHFHPNTADTNVEETPLPRSPDMTSMFSDDVREESSSTRQKSVRSSLPDESTSQRITPSNAWTGYSSVEAERFLQAVGVSPNKRLTETIGFALVDDAEMPPRAKCLDTILCLDSSSSMGQQGFQEMKRVACQLLDGIEDIAEHYDIEENIAVVAFGGRSRIEHYLSNDYGSVRDAIENLHFGGRSPLFEALLVSLCAYQGRGGSLNISGVHKIQPRLIIITDGIPSDEKEDTSMDVDKVDHNVVARLLKLMGRFNMRDKQNKGYPRPVFWIPVGNANVELMKSLASLGGGEVVASRDIMKLCKYQRIQETIGKIFAYIKKGMCHDTGDLTDDIKILIDAFSGDLGPEEKTEVLNTVKAKLEGKHGYDCPNDDPCDFDNVLEFDNTGLPPLGTRVVRGPHWKWDNQDTDGAGTVVNHNDNQKDWIWVLWDNGNHNRYRFGNEDCYDVEVVLDQPRISRSDMMIDVGCEVTRGPHWEERYQDQDGGPGGVGIVIRKNKSGEVKVRWRLTQLICSYRFGKDAQLDLVIRDPVDILKDLTAGPSYSPKSKGNTSELKDIQAESIQEEWSEDSRWVWQWQDEAGQWRLYPEEDIQKMEGAYGRRPNGSCLIRRCGVSCRVMFKDGIERGVDTESRIKIQRKRMLEDHIVVMRSHHYN